MIPAMENQETEPWGENGEKFTWREKRGGGELLQFWHCEPGSASGLVHMGNVGSEFFVNFVRLSLNHWEVSHEDGDESLSPVGRVGCRSSPARFGDRSGKSPRE